MNKKAKSLKRYREGDGTDSSPSPPLKMLNLGGETCYGRLMGLSYRASPSPGSMCGGSLPPLRWSYKIKIGGDERGGFLPLAREGQGRVLPPHCTQPGKNGTMQPHWENGGRWQKNACRCRKSLSSSHFLSLSLSFLI